MKKLRKVFGIISSMAFIVLGLVFGFSSLVKEQVSAFNQGGGMYFAAGNHVFSGQIGGKTLNGTDVYGCGIYNAGNLTISGGEIRGCKTYGKEDNLSVINAYGGGIYNISYCDVSGDVHDNVLYSSSLAYGGGIYSDGELALQHYGNVYNNFAAPNRTGATDSFDGRGGGIYVAGGKCSILGAGISGNGAYRGKGGGVYVASGAIVELIEGEIVDNICFGDDERGPNARVVSGAGGGVYIESGAEFYMLRNSFIRNNQATVGSAIYNEGLLSLIGPSEISGEIYTTQPIILGPDWIYGSNDYVRYGDFLVINFDGGSDTPIALISFVEPERVENPFPNDEAFRDELKSVFNPELIKITNAPDAELDFEYGKHSIDGREFEGWWLVAKGEIAGKSDIIIEVEDPDAGYIYSANRGLNMGKRTVLRPNGQSTLRVSNGMVEVDCTLQDESESGTKFSDTFLARGADPNEVGKVNKFSHWLFNGERVDEYTEFTFSGGGTLTAVFEKVDAVKVNFKFYLGYIEDSQQILDQLPGMPSIFEQTSGDQLSFYMTEDSTLSVNFNGCMDRIFRDMGETGGGIIVDGIGFIFRFYYSLLYSIRDYWAANNIGSLNEQNMLEFFYRNLSWKREIKTTKAVADDSSYFQATKTEIIPCYDNHTFDFDTLRNDGIYELNYELLFAVEARDYGGNWNDSPASIWKEYYKIFKERWYGYSITKISAPALPVAVQDGYEFNDIEKMVMAILANKYVYGSYPQWFTSTLMYENYPKFVSSGVADYEKLVEQGDIVFTTVYKVDEYGHQNEDYLKGFLGSNFALLFSNDLAFYTGWRDGQWAYPSTDELTSLIKGIGDVNNITYDQGMFFNFVKNFVIDVETYDQLYIQSQAEDSFDNISLVGNVCYALGRDDTSGIDEFTFRTGLKYMFTTSSTMEKIKNILYNIYYDEYPYIFPFIIDESLQVIDDTGKNRTEVVNEIKSKVSTLLGKQGETGLDKVFFILDDVRLLAMLNNYFWHNGDQVNTKTYTYILEYPLGDFNHLYDNIPYDKSGAFHYRFFLVNLVDNFVGSGYDSFSLTSLIMTKLNYKQAFVGPSKLETWYRILRSDIVNNCIFNYPSGYYMLF